MSSSENLQFIAEPVTTLQGSIRVPGDKSISHRSIMLGALASGVTHVKGFLSGEDNLATLDAFRNMGVKIEGPTNGEVTIHGVGMHGLQQPASPLYLGNSGTSMRLLSGLMAAQSFTSTLTGDSSLSTRPMKRVTDPLRLMGAGIATTENGTPPIKITGSKKLLGIDYSMPMASAQVKSCLLLAGLYAEGATCVTEPAPTRDHTERMLTGFGYIVQREGNRVCIRGGGELVATDIDVPADISSGAFFMVAGCIAKDSTICLEHVGINPTRIGVINILRAMGGDIEISNTRTIGGEPIADIIIKSSHLTGIHIDEADVPLAIDEFPAIFIAAACAIGETRLTGAEELRVKESDRIQVMADGLLKLGIDCQAMPDGIIIQGGQLTGGEVDSHGDHRIAMAFAMASLRARQKIVINDCANVATSFPNFIELAQQVGLKISTAK